MLGLGTHLGADALGWEFPSFAYSLGVVVWKLGILIVLVYAVRRFEGRRADAAAVGLTGDVKADERKRRTGRALFGLLGAFVLGAVISRIPGLGTSSGDATAYGAVTKVSVGLLVFELVVRYPLTVFAEEAFFRGFLQPRLPWAPPVLSGLLWAGFHLQQPSTIASLVPLGIGLGVIRWWTGNIRTTSVLHYAANAVFFVTNYA